MIDPVGALVERVVNAAIRITIVWSTWMDSSVLHAYQVDPCDTCWLRLLNKRAAETIELMLLGCVVWNLLLSTLTLGGRQQSWVLLQNCSSGDTWSNPWINFGGRVSEAMDSWVLSMSLRISHVTDLLWREHRLSNTVNLEWHLAFEWSPLSWHAVAQSTLLMQFSSSI